MSGVFGLVGSSKIFLTKDAENTIRQEAALQGRVIGKIRSDEDLLCAAVKTLPDHEIQALHDEITKTG